MKDDSIVYRYKYSEGVENENENATIFYVECYLLVCK